MSIFTLYKVTSKHGELQNYIFHVGYIKRYVHHMAISVLLLKLKRVVKKTKVEMMGTSEKSVLIFIFMKDERRKPSGEVED